ncbi:MAG TPA: nuclear transport factor 2 family protein [Phycisphaerales bacterium]|nr:nuclear transport factor 2 family protein [Phycisphaerales bacterium]
MLTRAAADAFARQWIRAWNSRDIEQILQHYTDDVVVSSPLIKAIAGEPSGTLRGKHAVRDYWSRALSANPDLHFVLQHVGVGINSVILKYRSVIDLLATEFMELTPDRKISRVAAHYNQPDLETAQREHAEHSAWLWVSHVTPILNVSDFAESMAWFEKLGFRRSWEWGTPPTFGAVGSGEMEIFLCLNGQGGRGRSALPRTGGPDGSDDQEKGVWMSLWVEDVDAVHARCVERGLEVTMPPTTEPWGVREMHVRHPDGHVLRISKGLSCE